MINEKKENIRRDNHYVPKFYLKNWTTQNRIQVYNLLVPNAKFPLWKSYSINSTGMQENLYVTVYNNQETDEIEKRYNEVIETPAAVIINSIIINFVIKEDDWDILNDYILAQFTRTPAFYFNSHNSLIQATNNVFRDFRLPKPEKIKKRQNVEQNYGNSLLPLSIKISNDDSHNKYLEITASVGKGMWLFSASNTMEEGNVVNQFFKNLRWDIVVCHPNYKWPTSDTPLSIYNPFFSNHFDNGIADRQNLFIFPLSPSILLVSYPNKKDGNKIIKASERETIGFITIIVNKAFRYVYDQAGNSIIPIIRPRVVDEKEFIRIKKVLDDWHDSYIKKESPYLLSPAEVIK